MKKIQEYILKGKEVFIGLEDSSRTWKICARSGRTVVHETTMPAKYEELRNYLHHKFPRCRIRIMYEAGFRGFEPHDSVVADGKGTELRLCVAYCKLVHYCKCRPGRAPALHLQNNKAICVYVF